MKGAPCCQRCGELIGVYEPLIMLLDGSARETSRAAETRRAGELAGDCYHRRCFEQRPQGPASLQT